MAITMRVFGLLALAISTVADQAPNPDCTYTKEIPAKLGSPGVKTLHASTETVSAQVDCRGCAAVRTVNPMGHGPELVFTATTLAGGAATETAYVCKETPVVELERRQSSQTTPSGAVTVTAPATVTGS
jgi:hypothetical protein